jgi:hypothetical protein
LHHICFSCHDSKIPLRQICRSGIVCAGRTVSGFGIRLAHFAVLGLVLLDRFHRLVHGKLAVLDQIRGKGEALIDIVKLNFSEVSTLFLLFGKMTIDSADFLS